MGRRVTVALLQAAPQHIVAGRGPPEFVAIEQLESVTAYRALRGPAASRTRAEGLGKDSNGFFDVPRRARRTAGIGSVLRERHVRNRVARGLEVEQQRNDGMRVWCQRERDPPPLAHGPIAGDP